MIRQWEFVKYAIQEIDREAFLLASKLDELTQEIYPDQMTDPWINDYEMLLNDGAFIKNLCQLESIKQTLEFLLKDIVYQRWYDICCVNVDFQCSECKLAKIDYPCWDKESVYSKFHSRVNELIDNLEKKVSN